MADNIIDHSLVNIVNGLPVPKLVLQEKVDQLKEMKLYPDDVWITSYNASGTTWMQQIVRLIHSNGEHDDRKLANAVPWLEASQGVSFQGISLDKFSPHDDLKVEDMPRPRAFKSHFTYELLPCGPPNTTPCKYIYIARNPKDVMVSMFFKTKGFMPNLEWDMYWADRNKFCLFGNHFDHILSWWPHRDEENILFLKYEDLKKDLPAAVAKIASFIGATLPSNIISKIADMARFENMKKDKSVEPSLMRKGTVENWKDIFTAEQSAIMDALYAEKFKGTGIKFDFE